jgi:hypothetical protein
MAGLTSAPAIALDEPFFLVGAERSGTTLLRLMLAHHRAIECAPEFEFLVETLPAAGGWPALESYHEWLSTCRIFLPHQLAIDRSLDFPTLARSFLDQYCRRTGKPIRGATCHRHFDRLQRIWPRARFVHLLRDGRDVARSCIGMGWAGNVWTGAERWIEAERLWSELRPRIEPGRRHELRYEDLIRSPERELERLCAFLGTGFDPAMLEYHRGTSYERPDPSLVGQWRKKLAPRELALLEARIGPLLRERGYEPSPVPAARVGPLWRTALRLQDRLARWRFRLRRYGLGLLLAGRVARLIRHAAWERSVTLARNEIDDRHLQ